MALTLDIVTPEGSKLHEEVDELTAPSVQGEFGVLPGHLPIVAALRTGIVRWKSKHGTGSGDGEAAIAAGFIEVAHDKASILTDRFSAKEEIDPVRVRADLKNVDEKIAQYPGSPTDAEFHDLVAEELWCAALLELHGDPPPATVSFVAEYGQAPEDTTGENEGAQAATVDEHE